LVAGDEYTLHVGSLPCWEAQQEDDFPSYTDQQNPKPPPAKYALPVLTFVHVRLVAVGS
jgi:hypothetical protein